MFVMVVSFSLVTHLAFIFIIFAFSSFRLLTSSFIILLVWFFVRLGIFKS